MSVLSYVMFEATQMCVCMSCHLSETPTITGTAMAKATAPVTVVRV